MKEFMLLIRNEMDHQSSWSNERHTQFLKSCEAYIKHLKEENKLISAQPLVREGNIISGERGKFFEKKFNENKEVIVGYYHILAKDIEEAVSIAKQNPEFEFSATARVEVRPIKMKEKETRFTYPSS